MTATTVTMLVSHDDEIRELKARTIDLEEAVLSLRQQIIILREALYDVAEGRRPTMVGVGS